MKADTLGNQEAAMQGLMDQVFYVQEFLDMVHEIKANRVFQSLSQGRWV